MKKKSKEDINAVKGISEEHTKDLDTKEMNKNNNEQSDSSYIIYSHTTKNPDDEGEGLEDINDKKVEANEQRLKHRNSIKVQQDPKTFAEKSYLCVMTRSSRKSIREDVIKTIEKYGSIQNVFADGNCAFYASIVCLQHQGISVNTNIKELRKSLYDHLQNTKKDIFNTMTFTGKKGRRTKQDFINQDVLPKLWKKSASYKQGCDKKSWLHADTMFPIMADFFKCNFIWFDIKNNYTKAIVCKKVKDEEKNVILTRKGFLNPKSLCSRSIWDRRVVCIYINYHYMAVKEYVKVK